jgi:hypothetical protein
MHDMERTFGLQYLKSREPSFQDVDLRFSAEALMYQPIQGRVSIAPPAREVVEYAKMDAQVTNAVWQQSQNIEKDLRDHFEKLIKEALKLDTGTIEVGCPTQLVIKPKEKSYVIKYGYGEERRAMGLVMKSLGYKRKVDE